MLKVEGLQFLLVQFVSVGISRRGAVPSLYL